MKREKTIFKQIVLVMIVSILLISNVSAATKKTQTLSKKQYEQLISCYADALRISADVNRTISDYLKYAAEQARQNLIVMDYNNDKYKSVKSISKKINESIKKYDKLLKIVNKYEKKTYNKTVTKFIKLIKSGILQEKKFIKGTLNQTPATDREDEDEDSERMLEKYRKILHDDVIKKLLEEIIARD